jgi:hypothetical protein
MNPQTEKQTVDELFFMTDEAFAQALDGLSFEALKAETLRQYKLSGEMLDKYRDASTKLEETRNHNSDLRRKNLQMSNEFAYLQRDLLDERDRLKGIKAMLDLSIDTYTHAMKRTVFKMIGEIACAAVNRLTDLADRANDRIGMNASTKKKEDEIPF